MSQQGYQDCSVEINNNYLNSHDPNKVEAAIDDSLEKLGVGYLDLYHMHWPVRSGSLGRNYIDYRDTWNAMSALVEDGKTRHIGVSNFSPNQMENLLNHTSHTPSVHQMEYVTPSITFLKTCTDNVQTTPLPPTN